MQHRSLVLWKNVNETMTREQFESAIEYMIPLVLLDNLVLNVGEFMNQHPGGRFLIRHNIGHDVSKYFYGGYCLEGNQGSKPA
jgi:cytochrome b involved in lipid metabolism